MAINKKYLQNRKTVVNTLDLSYHYKENMVKLSEHETPEHALAKHFVCKELIDLKNRILTEAIFKDSKGRADIINITNLTIYEIVKSESEKSQKVKENKYPNDYDILFLNANDVIKTNLSNFKY